MDDPKSAFNGAFADAASFSKKVRLMWFGAGSGETQFVKTVEETGKKLEDLGIRSTSYISQGTFHEWHTWRRHLNEFAPLLFK
jgi:enterochelin esterase family protein